MATILVVDDDPTARDLLVTVLGYGGHQLREAADGAEAQLVADRKSTRLNSSHDQISYAVFCLKKKKRDFAVRKIAPQSIIKNRYTRASSTMLNGVSAARRTCENPPSCSTSRRRFSPA